MQTPIDLSTLARPVKEKYLDEETPAFARWIVFGGHADGTVDVYDPSTASDVLVQVPRQVAEQIVEARNRFSSAMVSLVNTGQPYTKGVPEFAALDRGWRSSGTGGTAGSMAVGVKCDRERPRDQTGLEYTPVMVDGEKYLCLGVERFLKATPIAKGEEIALLVTPWPAPEQVHEIQRLREDLATAHEALQMLSRASQRAVKKTPDPHRVLFEDGYMIEGRAAAEWFNFMMLIQRTCGSALSSIHVEKG